MSVEQRKRDVEATSLLLSCFARTDFFVYGCDSTPMSAADLQQVGRSGAEPSAKDDVMPSSNSFVVTSLGLHRASLELSVLDPTHLA